MVKVVLVSKIRSASNLSQRKPRRLVTGSSIRQRGPQHSRKRAQQQEHLTHLVDVLLFPCPLVGVVVAPPVLHFPLLHDDDVGADPVQEVLQYDMREATPQDVRPRSRRKNRRKKNQGKDAWIQRYTYTSEQG